MHKIMGIVSMNEPNITIEGICDYRPMSVASFMGRYRLIDFPLSNFSTSSINQIQVYFNDKPRSLIEHISGTQQYNINSKHGKIHLLSAEVENHNALYNTDIQAYNKNMRYIDIINADYVVIAPVHAIYQCDFQAAIDYHKAQQADITMLYAPRSDADSDFMHAKTLELNHGQQVVGMDINRGCACEQNIFLDTYILRKELFQSLCKSANERSSMYWFKDIVHDHIQSLRLIGYPIHGKVGFINDLSSYYATTMNFNNIDTAKALMKDTWPVYTQTNDSPPTHYGESSDVKKSLIANGSKIEGTIINCVVGRGVHVKKGAIITNSIISANAIIEEGANISYAVLDKRAHVSKQRSIMGNKNNIVYIKKYDEV
ncbi:MAG: glucose-1-phosphate adenylyltransferase subunit GlgD [Erysipelotrichaceae bacterium]